MSGSVKFQTVCAPVKTRSRGPVSRHDLGDNCQARALNGLFASSLQVKIDRIVGRAQRFRRDTRRNVDPGIAAFASRASKKFIESRYDWFGILLAEVGPRVVVNGFVDCLLFHTHRTVAGRQHTIGLCRRFPFIVFPHNCAAAAASRDGRSSPRIRPMDTVSKAGKLRGRKAPWYELVLARRRRSGCDLWLRSARRFLRALEARRNHPLKASLFPL